MASETLPSRLRSLAEMLVLAMGYYATGRLALLMAIPPGYATAVWPAAGVALAGTLLFGLRAWPGVLLGSFCINFWTSFDAHSAASVLKSLALAGSIGSGAALQAVVGAVLVRRFAGFPSPLAQPRDVIRFLTLGGPVSCLISAAVGTVSLACARAIAVADVPKHWLTWWMGDTIGALTFAPLILMWAAPLLQVSLRRQISVSLPLVLAFALIVILFLNTRTWEQKQAWSVLAGGLLLIGLLGALLLVVTGHAVEVEGLVEQHKQAEQRFRVAVEAAPNAMLTVDRQGRMTLANSQAERLFGYKREEMLGQPIEMLVPERFRAQHPGHRAGFFHAPATRPMGGGRDLFGLRKDGSEVPIEIGLNPIETAEGTFVLASIIDITERKGAENALKESLRQSRATIERQEKLASLGVLAAGVAHEIRNPLTAIKFRLFSLRKSLPAAANNEDATIIGSEINRLERIVKDFLQFARPTEPELVNVPANRLLGEVHDLLRPQLAKASIRLNLESGADAWVRADTQQLKQVLINLIQNAADSIGRNGAITLRVASDRASSPRPTVVLEVTDTGKGILPEVQQRLFDPFFTTKEGGTGLGLPIAERIVEKHGGVLRYETHPGRGTTFSIVLPASPEHE